jgi:myxalamid-type polyketide synthase MxaB
VRTGSATWDVQTFDSDGNLVVALEGFEMRKAPAAAFLRRRLADWLYRVDWQPQGVVAQSAAGPATWLVLDNGSQLGAGLVRRLVARGDRCLIVSEGDAFHGADSVITVNPMGPRDFRRVFDLCAQQEGPPVRGVIHLWGASQGKSPDPAERAQYLAIGMLHLVQAVAAGSAKLRSWVVTAGAQAVEPGETVHPEQAPLWGMVRSLMPEAPDLQITCIDAGSDPDGAAEALLAELDAAPGESQVAYRGAERLVARLVRCPDAVPAAIEGPFRLQLKEYGSPDNLQLAPLTRQKPGRTQVEIAVKATALNFRDVVIALGVLRDFYAKEMGIERAADIPLGFDCAGVISAVGEGVTDLAVGDEVMSPAVGGAASHVIAFREAVMRIPKGSGSGDGRVAAERILDGLSLPRPAGATEGRRARADPCRRGRRRTRGHPDRAGRRRGDLRDRQSRQVGLPEVARDCPHHEFANGRLRRRDPAGDRRRGRRCCAE